jgi:hypothetical protein
MKSFLYGVALLTSSLCFANQLHNFDQVTSVVRNGKLIRIFIDYTKCSKNNNIVIPNNAAVYTPNALAWTAEGKIGAYLLYFTTKDPRYPAKPVYQYIRYLLSNDNTVKLTFSVFNAADYAVLEEESSIICKIDNGAIIFASNESELFRAKAATT